MKRVEYLVLSGLFAILSFVNSNAGNIPTVCKGINLKANVPIPAYKVVSERDVHGLCEIILNIQGHFVPIYATKDFVIAGEMFSHKKQVTQRQIWEIKSKILKDKFKTSQKDLNSLSVAEFNPKAKKFVYFIVDPLCPYCEQAKSKLADMAKKHNFGVKLVFYPVHGAPAIRDIKGFICSHKTFKDYLIGDFGTGSCQKGEEYAQKSINTCQKLMVNGTPTIITYKGDFILGYQPQKVLESLGYGSH